MDLVEGLQEVDRATAKHISIARRKLLARDMYLENPSIPLKLLVPRRVHDLILEPPRVLAQPPLSYDANELW